MVPRDVGGVINVASVSAFVRQPGGTSYAATKSWMTVFTEGLYLELKSLGSRIAVQALCPGYTYSEFHDKLGVKRDKQAPSTFWMTAEQVVDASLRGLHQRKLFVVPGWYYRALVSILPKLPSALRLVVESSSAGRRGGRQILSEDAQHPQLDKSGGNVSTLHE
jgi:short-subunit dehydrogenase